MVYHIWRETRADKLNARLGRTLLELGGNNGIIVAPSADLNLAVRAILFGAIGTSGQRRTSTCRVIIHESIYSTVSKALIKAYKSIRFET
jgi:aldehyde dehydrogenase (NAD+)